MIQFQPWIRIFSLLAIPNLDLDPVQSGIMTPLEQSDVKRLVAAFVVDGRGLSPFYDDGLSRLNEEERHGLL